jgi:hypothetical protein
VVSRPALKGRARMFPIRSLGVSRPLACAPDETRGRKGLLGSLERGASRFGSARSPRGAGKLRSADPYP